MKELAVRSSKPQASSSAGAPPLGGFAPLSIARAIWNHRALCVAVWLLVTATVVLIVRRLPNVYRAETSILVESQRIPEKYVSATVTPDLQDRLNQLSNQILSYARLLDLIQRFGLYREERRHHTVEEIVAEMRSDIKLKADNGAAGHPGSFQISYQGPNAVVVAQVVQEIGTFFIDEDIRERSVEAEGTSQFLENQLAEAKRRLEAQERMLSQYKIRYNGELPEQENALLASSGQMKTQLAGVQDEMSRVQGNATMLEAALDNAVAEEATLNGILEEGSSVRQALTGSPGATLAPAPQKESERLEAQLAALRVRYGDEYPDVRRIRTELEHAREAEKNLPAAVPKRPAADTSTPANTAVAAYAARVARQPRPAALASQERIANLKSQIASAHVEIENLKAERDRLLRGLNEVDAHIQQLPLRQQELASVTRDYETTQTEYKSLLDKKLAADIAANMEKDQKAERFVMLDPARVPEAPIKPKRPLLDAAGCIAALIISCMLALAIEFSKGTLLGDWEIPSSADVLARIPKIQLPASSATTQL